MRCLYKHGIVTGNQSSSLQIKSNIFIVQLVTFKLCVNKREIGSVNNIKRSLTILLKTKLHVQSQTPKKSRKFEWRERSNHNLTIEKII